MFVIAAKLLLVLVEFFRWWIRRAPHGGRLARSPLSAIARPFGETPSGRYWALGETSGG